MEPPLVLSVSLVVGFPVTVIPAPLLASAFISLVICASRCEPLELESCPFSATSPEASRLAPLELSYEKEIQNKLKHGMTLSNRVFLRPESNGGDLAEGVEVVRGSFEDKDALAGADTVGFRTRPFVPAHIQPQFEPGDRHQG